MGSFTKKFEIAPLALNFDDLILLPGLSETRTRDITLQTRFTNKIKIKSPLVASPMDTVTEAEMGIAIAQSAGIAVLHRNCPIEDQVAMAKKVKDTEPKSADATIDENGRLSVAAAISPFDIDRAKSLSNYVDAFVTDVAHFHTKAILESTKKIMKETGKEVVIGSLGTKEGVADCLSKLDDVAGLRVGIGGGSICITTDVTKAGSPTLFATSQAADALEELGLDVPIIADGGIRSAGDAALAFAFGADSAMLGYCLAGTAQCPGEIKEVNGIKFKAYRGMGSRGARERRAIVDRYSDTGGKKIEEGIEGYIPYKGDVVNVIELLDSGIRAAIGYAGAGSINEMKKKARVARTRNRTVKAEIKTY
ncbi:MAG: guanosine monophosphate reductase [Candidatus Micrarchaeota archaeon]|nr:guanosine monophosphate reductase [Candidatus Micrarchaeota archaeon]